MKELTEFQQEFLAIFKRNGVTFHNRKGEISDTTTNCVTVTDTATNEVILKITFSDENILEILENIHNKWFEACEIELREKLSRIQEAMDIDDIWKN